MYLQRPNNPLEVSGIVSAPLPTFLAPLGYHCQATEARIDPVNHILRSELCNTVHVKRSAHEEGLEVALGYLVRHNLTGF
jgi:hypothetical protein